MDPKGKVAAHHRRRAHRSGRRRRAGETRMRPRRSSIEPRATRQRKPSSRRKQRASMRSPCKADVRDPDQIEAAVNETVESLGRLDILVNMASTYLKTPNPTEATGPTPSIATRGASFCSRRTPPRVMKVAARAASSISPIGCRSAAGPATRGSFRTTLRRPRCRR